MRMVFLSATLVFLVGGGVVAPMMIIAVVVPSHPSPLLLAAETLFVLQGAVHTPAAVLAAVLLVPPMTAIQQAIDAAKSVPPPGGLLRFATAPALLPPLSLGPILTAAAATLTVIVARARTTMLAFALIATVQTIFFVFFNLLCLYIQHLKLHPFPSDHYSQLSFFI